MMRRIVNNTRVQTVVNVDDVETCNTKKLFVAYERSSTVGQMLIALENGSDMKYYAWANVCDPLNPKRSYVSFTDVRAAINSMLKIEGIDIYEFDNFGELCDNIDAMDSTRKDI